MPLFKSRKPTIFLTFAAIFASRLAASRADVATWLNPVSGNWTDPTKWSTNPIFPNDPASDVIFAATGSSYIATIQAQNSIRANSVTLASPYAWLEIDGALQTNLIDVQSGNIGVVGLHTVITEARIQGPGQLSAGGQATFVNTTLAINTNATGFFNLGGTFALDASIFSIGTILPDNSAATGTITANVPMFSGIGTISFNGGTSMIHTAGSLGFASGITVITGTGDGNIVASTITNYGTFIITPNRSLTLNGVFNNLGTVNLDQGSMFIGAVSQSGMGDFNRTIGTFLNVGSLIADSGGNFDIDAAFHGFVRLTRTTDVSHFTASTGSLLYLANWDTNYVNTSFTAPGGVTLSCDTQVISFDGGTVTFGGGLILDNHNVNVGTDMKIRLGVDRLLGTGQLIFTTPFTSSSSSLDGPAGGSLTVTSGITLRNLAGALGLGGQATFINQGVISVEGGTVVLQGNYWKNQGTIVLQSGGNITFTGTFRPADIGILVLSGTSSLQVSYGTVDNANSNFVLDGAHGQWAFVNGSIQGGTLTSGGGSLKFLNTGLPVVLNAVTLAGDFSSSDFGRTTFTNGVTLDSATIRNELYVTFSGTQLLDGHGTIYVENTLFSPGFEAADGTLTIGSDIAIRISTASGQILGSVINKGIVASEVHGRTFTIQGSPFINQGTLTVANGGAISAVNLTNTATLTSVAGNIILSGAIANSGQMYFSASSVTANPSAEFVNSGSIALAATSAVFNNTFSNQATVSAINATGLTIRSLNNSSTGTFTIDSSTLTLSGVSINFGHMNATNGASLRETGTLTNSSIISISSGAAFYDLGHLDNAGTLTFDNAYFFTSNSATIGGAFMLSNATGAFVGSLSSINSPVDLATLPFGNLGSGAVLSSLTLTNSGPTIPGIYATAISTTPALFDNVSLNTPLVVHAHAILAVSHTLTLSGISILGDDQALSSPGTLLFNPGAGIAGSGTLGPTLLTTFSSGSFTQAGTLSNLGTVQIVSADLTQSQNIINPGTFLLNQGTLTQSPDATFLNNGTISLVSGGILSQNGSLANSGNLTLNGSTSAYSQNAILTNAGTISVVNRATLFQNASFNNAGVISVTGAGSAYSLNASLSNTGTISVLNSAAIYVAAPIDNAGTFTVDNAFVFYTGQFTFNGSLIRNNATFGFVGTLTAVNSDFGNVPFIGHSDLGTGASLSNLTLSSSSGAIGIYRASNTASVSFTNLSLSADLTLHSGTTLTIANTFIFNNSTVHIGDGTGGALVQVNSNASFSGTGTILFDAPSGSSLTFGIPFFTIPASLAIRTGAGSGIISNVSSNLGIMSAETPGMSLSFLSPIFMGNRGTLTATNGGSINVNHWDVNSGQVYVGAGSTITFASANGFSQSGTITADGGSFFMTLTAASFNIVQATNGGALTFTAASTSSSATFAKPLFVSTNSSASFNIPVSLTAVTGNGNMSLATGRSATSDGVTANSLALASNAAWTFRNSTPPKGTSKLNSLSLSHTNTGTAASYFSMLQLNSNHLIVQSTDPADKASKILALNEAIYAGHNGSNNAWSATQGITSATVAADATHLTLGVYDNAALHALGNSSQPRTNWAGGTGNVDTNSLLITPALKGDANLDGIIDIADMIVIANNWNLAGKQNGISTIDMAHGDVNQDGIVDIADMVVVANNWSATSSFNLAAAMIDGGTSAPGSGSDLPPAQVPEPTSLLLLTVGGLAGLRRSRPRHS